MSTELTVNSKALLQALNVISYLIPKGINTVPLGVTLKDNVLRLTCKAGCIYTNDITVENMDNKEYSISVLYHNIVPLVPTSGNMCLEFTQAGLSMHNDYFETLLPVGYSIVTEVDDKIKCGYFQPVSNQAYKVGISKLLNMNLDKLYERVKPIYVFRDISVLKYPNVHVQVRTTGLPFTGILDIEHAKLIEKFDPSEVCSQNRDMLVLRNENAYLQLPINSNVGENTFTKLMDDLANPVTLDLTGYLERMRNASKLAPKASCRITLYESGLKSTISVENVTTSISTGDTTTKVVQVVTLPIQVWLTFLKAVGSGMVQFLSGGQKLCMRTQSIIILAHVIL